MKHPAIPLGATRHPASCDNPFMLRSRRGLTATEWSALALSVMWIAAIIAGVFVLGVA